MKKLKYILPFLALLVIFNGCKEPSSAAPPPPPVKTPVTGVEITHNGLTILENSTLYVELDNKTTTINVKLLPAGVQGRVLWGKGDGFDNFAELTPAPYTALSAAVLGIAEGEINVSLRAYNNDNSNNPITFDIPVKVVKPGELPVLSFNVFNGGAVVAQDSVVTLFTGSSIELTAQLLPASVAKGENVIWSYAENEFANMTLSSDNMAFNLTGVSVGSFNVNVEAGNHHNAFKLRRRFSVNVIEPPPNPEEWVERQWTQYVGNLNGVAYGNGVFVAGGASSRTIWAKEDMIWTAADQAGMNAMNKMIFHDGKFWGVFTNAGQESAVSNSTDGKTWTPSTDDLGAAFGIGSDGNRRLIIGGWSGNSRASLNSGNAWNMTNTFSQGEIAQRQSTIRGFAYGEGGRVVAIGSHWYGTPSEPHAYISFNDDDGLGTWTNANYSSTTHNLNAIVYAQGRFVTVGTNGVMLHSSDGIEWEAIVNKGGLTDSINTIVYANGQFVAGANGGRIAYSLDGINWTAAKVVPNFNILSIAYGGDKWVAVGANGRIAYSGGLDTVKYPVATLTVTNETRKPAVVVTTESTFTMADNREIEMSASVDPEGRAGQIIEWSASGTANITITAEDGGKRATLKGTVGSSGDGNIITVRARNNDNVNPVVLTFIINVYDHTVPRPITKVIIINEAGGIENDGLVTLAPVDDLSTTSFKLDFEPEDVDVDLITWSHGNSGITVTPSEDNKTAELKGNIAGLGSNKLTVTVSVKNSSMTEMTSASFSAQVVKPPLAWKNSVVPDFTLHVNGIAYGNGVWVAGGGVRTGSSAGPLVYSENGRVWTKLPDFATAIRSLAFIEELSLFFAGGSNGQIFRSSDGKNWTQLPTVDGRAGVNLNFTYGEGRLAVAGSSWNRIMYSTNSGNAWTASPSDTSGTLFGMAHDGKSTWVAVEQSVAVGGGGNQPGLIRYSTNNLASWKAVPAADSLPPVTVAYSGLYGVAHGNGVFIAVGDNNRLLYSNDGMTWTTVASTFNGNFITHGNGYFASANNGNAIRVTRDGTKWVSAVRTGISGADAFTITYANGLWIAGGSNGSISWASENDADYDKVVVGFNANTYDEVTNLPAAAFASSGAPVTQPVQIPEREVYRFDGWFKEALCANQWNFSDNVNNDMILYAKWSVVHPVIFDANAGGDNVTNLPSNLTGAAAVIHGGLIGEPVTPPVRTGYKFLGWYREAAGINPWNFTIDTVTTDITLYAKWIAVWNVTFNANAGGGTVTGMPSNLAPYTGVEHGSLIPRPPNNPQRSGYTFIQWFKEPACTNQWNFASDTVTAAVVLYAGWIMNEAGKGSAEITLTWLDEKNIFAETFDDMILSRRDGETLTVTVTDSGANPVLFMVNGEVVSSSGNSYTFNAATRVNGFYEIEAVVVKGGKYYSAGFRVRVIN